MPGVPITLKTEEQRAIFQSMKAYEGALVQTYMSAMTKFASMAIQGAFILNGTVGIAAFASKNIGSYYPVFLCSLGAVCALLASCFAFLAQRKIFVLDRNIHDENVIITLGKLEDKIFALERLNQYLQKRENSRNFWILLCVFSVVLSIGLFCYGLYQTMQIYQIEINA